MSLPQYTTQWSLEAILATLAAIEDSIGHNEAKSILYEIPPDLEEGRANLEEMRDAALGVTKVTAVMEPIGKTLREVENVDIVEPVLGSDGKTDLRDMPFDEEGE